MSAGGARTGLIGIMALACVFFCNSPASAQDRISIARMESPPGSIVEVPIHVTDLPGTPLGEDCDFSSRIQAFALHFSYTNPSAIKSISVSRAGEPGTSYPWFEASRSYSRSLASIFSFRDLVHDLNGSGGDVAKITVTLQSDAPPGTVIDFKFVSATTMLSNYLGTVSETVNNEKLALENGSLTVNNPTSLLLSKPVKSTREGSRKTAKFRISRSTYWRSPLRVAFKLSGSAKNGRDYRKIKTSVVIPNGKWFVDIPIKAIDDRRKEKKEKVTLTLQRSSLYTIERAASATVTISDND